MDRETTERCQVFILNRSKDFRLKQSRCEHHWKIPWKWNSRKTYWKNWTSNWRQRKKTLRKGLRNGWKQWFIEFTWEEIAQMRWEVTRCWLHNWNRKNLECSKVLEEQRNKEHSNHWDHWYHSKSLEVFRSCLEI